MRSARMFGVLAPRMRMRSGWASCRRESSIIRPRSSASAATSRSAAAIGLLSTPRSKADQPRRRIVSAPQRLSWPSRPLARRVVTSGCRPQEPCRWWGRTARRSSRPGRTRCDRGRNAPPI